MKRLVYRPKIWAYVKTDKQALDLSPYIVSGTVDRVINAPSSASLTLRNPDFMFTTPGAPAFHPMDPITIYMARNISRPVRVFTGFLDTTPYLQLFPGTITLEASCTMKKLKHTYWDPALPFSNAFIAQYGWTAQGDGIMRNTKELAQNLTPDSRKLSDGGFQNVLFGVLEAVGGWNEKDIFIEELPTNIIDMVTKIFDGFKTENKETEKALRAFLKEAIGETAAGAAVTNGSGSNPNYGSPQGPVKFKDGSVVEATVYGPPWNAMEGGGQTKSGVRLPGPTNSSKMEGPYIIAADNDWIPIHNKVYIWPNPFNYKGTFSCEDTGGAFQGRTGRIDIFDPRGRRWQNSFGGVRGLRGNKDGPSGGKYVKIWDAKNGNPFNGTSNDGPRQTHSPPGSATEGMRHGGVVRASNNSSSSHKPKYARGKGAPTIANITGGTDLVNAAVSTVDKRIPRYASGDGRAVRLAKVQPQTDNPIFGPITGQPNTPGSGNSNRSRRPTGAQIDHKGTRNNDRKELARKILTYSGRNLSFPLGTTSDGGSAQKNLQDTERTGKCTVTASNSAVSGAAKGQAVQLSVDMLKAILECLENGVKLPINCLVNGEHSASSNHYSGNAVDLDGQMGDNSSDSRKMIDIFGKHGGSNNGEKPSNASHWHFDFTGGAGTGQAGDASGGAVAAGVTKEQAQGIATASAFATTLEMPSEAEKLEALGLQGQKSYLNDKPLIDFIEQLCTASMRHYMSLPDGRFYAFFPDHFGTFRPERGPYWEIDDIELIEGSMSLSDEELKTHVYVVGDTSNYDFQLTYADRLQTAGVVTIFNAFESNWLLSQQGTKGRAALFKDASTFLARYGVRPDYHPEPLIRSHFFEAFCALNRFMFLWSRQFLTQFQFTFMPELYPGGRVAFKDHDLVCYVDSVQHQFDYTGGFQTFAQLSAPSAKDTNNDGMMEKFTYGMVQSK